MTETTPATVPATTAFLKAHERLIIIVLVAAAAFLFYSKGISYLASRDQIAASKAATVLQAQVDANAKEAGDVKNTLQQYQQLAGQLIASNQAIATAQKKVDASTQKQQATDKTLPPPQLAARWTELLKVSPDTVQSSQAGYMVAPDTATRTVVQLESVPQLQSDLDGQKQVASNLFESLGHQNKVVDTLTTQVDGLNKQIVDETKACMTEVTAVKAQARRGKLKWFFIGVAAGFIGREVIKP